MYIWIKLLNERFRIKGKNVPLYKTDEREYKRKFIMKVINVPFDKNAE